jgi:hypothetical protein
MSKRIGQLKRDVKELEDYIRTTKGSDLIKMTLAIGLSKKRRSLRIEESLIDIIKEVK